MPPRATPIHLSAAERAMLDEWTQPGALAYRHGVRRSIVDLLLRERPAREPDLPRLGPVMASGTTRLPAGGWD